MRTTRRSGVARAVALVIALGDLVFVAEADHFAFFRPWIAITDEDRERLDRNEVLVRVLPAERDEIAVLAATALNTSSDVVASRLRAVADLYRGRHIHAIQAFSEPPHLDDLSRLMLDEVDLEGLRRCDADRCGLKLTATEIASLRDAIRAAGPTWRDAAHEALRALLLERVNTYRLAGFAGLPPYDQRGEPVRPHEVFASLLKRSPYLERQAPAVGNDRRQSSAPSTHHVKSLLYWSTVQYGGKPVVTVTDLRISTTEGSPTTPAVLAVSRQVLATHYMNGALGVTAFFPRSTGSGGHLVYVNRTEVDVLGGILRPLKRAILESRIKSEGARALRELRARFESVSITESR